MILEELGTELEVRGHPCRLTIHELSVEPPGKIELHCRPDHGLMHDIGHPGSLHDRVEDAQIPVNE